MSFAKKASCLLGKSIEARVVGIEDASGGSSGGKIGMSVEVGRGAYEMSVLYDG
jgi:hypothetical protein